MLPSAALGLTLLAAGAPAVGGQATSPPLDPLHRVLTPPGAPPPSGIVGDPYAYHDGPTLLCSDCHSVHYSESHGFAGPDPVSTTGAPGGDWLGPIGPNPYLLKSPTSTELCLECHDDKTFAPDVLGADVNGLTMRSAGFFGDVGVFNRFGHNLSLDPDAGVPPRWQLCGRCHFGGDMRTASVQCVDCHNPHGNNSFRNLWWPSAPGSEPPLVAYVRPGNLGLARYEADNVAYPAPSPGVSSWREITNICIDCHHTFFSPDYTLDASPYLRHPGTNTEWDASYPIDRAGANTDPVFWTTGESEFLVPRVKFVVRGATTFAAASTVAPDNEVFCLTCHQAHGSQNPFALRWDYGMPGVTGPSGCFQCHRNVLLE